MPKYADRPFDRGYRRGPRGILLQEVKSQERKLRRRQFHPPSLMSEVIGPDKVKVIYSNDHRRNFLDAIRSGNQPISPIDAAVSAEVMCQQADMAMHLRRKLRWDPQKEVFLDSAEANRMRSRPIRSPWHL